MMRKICHLFLFLVIQFLFTNQAECQPGIKSDTIYYWSYYSGTDPTVELKLKSRVIDIEYDGDKIISQVSQRLQDGLWENNTKYINRYDDFGNQTLFLMQLWKDGNWINYEKREWLKDDIGNDLSLHSKWENHTWVNDSKNVIEWSEDEKTKSSTYLRWDGNYWINQSKYVTTYTDNGDESVHTSYNWVFGIWENANRYSYLYNQDNQMVAYVYKDWYEHKWLKQDSNVYFYDDSPEFANLSMNYGCDMVNQEWYLGGRTIYEYSSNYNSMVRTTQSGHEGDWRNFRRDFFTAAPDGTWMPDRLEEWENESWWPFFEIKRYYYDSNSMYIHVRKDWDYYHQLRSWDSTYWVPPAPNGSNENSLFCDNLLVYPNPSDGFIRVMTDMKPVTISVYNLKGEVVFKDYLAGRKSTEIDLRFLPAGLYNIDSFDGTRRRTAKVIIKQ